MIFKRYLCASIAEACEKVEAELGAEAYILNTSRVRVGGLFGLFGSWKYEVLASTQVPSTGPASPEVLTEERHLPPIQESLRETRKLPVAAGPVAHRTGIGEAGSFAAAALGIDETHEPFVSPGASTPASSPLHGRRSFQPPRFTEPAAPVEDSLPPIRGSSPDEMHQIRTELRELKGLLKGIVGPVPAAGGSAPRSPAPASPRAEAPSPRMRAAPSPAMREVLQALEASELGKDIIEEMEGLMRDRTLPEQRHDSDALKQMVVDHLSSGMLTKCGIGPREGEGPQVVAMVGPTGVGKTTSLAKLGAGLKFNKGLEVGFITVDTFRIAAPEQLKKYAEILEVPVEVVFEPERIPEAIEAMRDKDVILIDTAGRNPKNRSDLVDLKRFLDVGLPIETYLVLSATTKLTDLLDIVDRFGETNFDKLIFTKLDETENFGSMISALRSLERTKSVCYVTTGQNVPDDIQPADASHLARLLFDRSLQRTDRMATVAS